MAAAPRRVEHPRARRGISLGRAVALAAAAAVLAVGATLAVVATPPMADASVQPTRALKVAELNLQLPTLAVDALPATGPVSWDIAIATTGYQHELDECQWVRMDLSAIAPIVGAHNYCGGDIVLDMVLGDSVRLAGTDLDGTYVVSEIRDARTGEAAADATEGMSVSAILQTCYWDADGTVRLVGLVPAA